MIWFVVCFTLSGAAGKLPDGDTLHRTYLEDDRDSFPALSHIYAT
jgi:hypothetical protein